MKCNKKNYKTVVVRFDEKKQFSDPVPNDEDDDDVDEADRLPQERKSYTSLLVCNCCYCRARAIAAAAAARERGAGDALETTKRRTTKRRGRPLRAGSVASVDTAASRCRSECSF